MLTRAKEIERERDAIEIVGISEMSAISSYESMCVCVCALPFWNKPNRTKPNHAKPNTGRHINQMYTFKWFKDFKRPHKMTI